MRCAVLINPKSRRAEEAEAAAEALRAAGLEIEIEHCKNLEAARETVKQKAGSCDAALVAGGDGTLHGLADALVEAGRPVGILPLGTANDLARTLEIPTDLEINDNIVAFWTPARPALAGEELAFDYRLTWGSIEEPDERIARVVGMRTGEGGVAGLEKERKAAGLRKFVVDFKGEALDRFTADAELQADVSVNGGSDVQSVVSPVEANGTWRLAIDLMPDSDDPVELSAFLSDNGERLTETWYYQWRRTDGTSS